MGIPNLLRFMKPFIEPIHVKKYSGRRVGIDAYSWLHKGAYSCSMELCLGSKSDGARRYLKYFMHHINLLRHYNITPVVVFDGGNIPCKSATELERNKRRETNLALAKEKMKEGDITTAVELFQVLKAVQITPSMAHQLIKILRSERIEIIVAPYEADAQLAYLSTLDADEGAIEAVITEDSDLIAYGCPAIIYKMDRYGNGEEFVMDRAFNTTSVKPLKPLEKKHKQALKGDLDILGPWARELPAVVATAIAEGRLNPLTMETFDNLGESERCSEISYKERWVDDNYVAVNDQLPLQCVPSSETTYTLNSNLFSEKEGINENYTDFTFNQEKYTREALALGRLIAPPRILQRVDKQVSRTELPNNNPFKRKSESGIQNEEKRRNVCEGSGESMSKVNSEVKNHKKAEKNEGGGILRFFQRL
ncbi:Exonuclease 1 [Apostasia shenzhenica]|uniref:Exonuclease 1 n=1 Tax=Apostasia shenzhenica TaxID=1088818 RepID=A0A2I0AEZ9_9ASPA|nr:Exonuclease 1 [Apostasia shenzhenica]